MFGWDELFNRRVYVTLTAELLSLVTCGHGLTILGKRPGQAGSSYISPTIITMSWFRKKDSAIPPVNEPARSSYLGTGASAGIGRSPSPGIASRSHNQPPSFMNNDPYERSQAAQGAGPQSTAPASAGRAASNTNLGERFRRNDPVGDPYARGRGNIDQDRAELFSGYDPEKNKPTGRFADNTASRDFPESMPSEANEEDEVEGIKKQTRALKQDSAASTRNALRIAREAEETARNTLTRLGDQSGECSFIFYMNLLPFNLFAAL